MDGGGWIAFLSFFLHFKESQGNLAALLEENQESLRKMCVDSPLYLHMILKTRSFCIFYYYLLSSANPFLFLSSTVYLVLYIQVLTYGLVHRTGFDFPFYSLHYFKLTTFLSVTVRLNFIVSSALIFKIFSFILSSIFFTIQMPFLYLNQVPTLSLFLLFKCYLLFIIIFLNLNFYPLLH